MEWDKLLYISAGRGDIEATKRCLEHNAKTTFFGYTALNQASKNGHWEIVKLLVEYGVNINDRDKISNDTALMVALEQNHFEVVKLLVENGADVNATNDICQTALDLAKTDEIREYLINRANIDWNIQLLASVIRDDFNKIEQCLKNGADIDAKDNDGETALMIAIPHRRLDVDSSFDIEYSKRYLNRAKYLIDAGANVNAKDNFCRTALMLASIYEHLEIVKLLVANGANVNAKDNNGQSPLSFASESCNKEIVEFLIKNGADVNAKDNDGFTALMCAVALSFQIFDEDIERSLETIRVLVENGANINAKDNDGETALDKAKTDEVWELLVSLGAKITSTLSQKDLDNELYDATKNGDLEKVKECLTNGANVNITQDFGLTPLMWAAGAAHKGHLEIVKLLVEHGADIEAKDSNAGYTALIFAAKREEYSSGFRMVAIDTFSIMGGNTTQLEIVKYLVEQGANINARSSYNTTALMEAAYKGNFEIVKFLVQNGADVNIKNNDNKTALDAAKTDEIALFLIDVANRNR